MNKPAAMQRLIRWYRGNRILYPWRLTRSPYRIWLSEVLLQQTRIPIALRYYERILKRYPALADLSRADESEFLSLWSGAGYYTRGQNMLRCARQITGKYQGTFPREFDLLVELPGIGRYIAGALSNICFEKLTPAIDGNIGRVLARLGNIHLPIHSNEFNSRCGDLYRRLAAGQKPSEFFQAMMELGERVCLPRPRCDTCPVRLHCLAHQKNTVLRLPARRPKRKPEYWNWYLLLLPRQETFYYVRNPDRNFLKAAWLFPDIFSKQLMNHAELKGEFRKKWGINVRALSPVETLPHTVTFRKIAVYVFEAQTYKLTSDNGKWMDQRDILQHPTSSIISKILSVLNH